MFYGISARKKGTKKYQVYNLSSNSFNDDKCLQSLWNDKQYVESIMSSLKEIHKKYEFKINTRFDL